MTPFPAVRGLLLGYLAIGGMASEATMTACGPESPAAPIPDVRLSKVAVGFEQPLFLTGDGSGRLLVVEQAGRIREIDPATGRPGRVLLDITERVKSGGEMGLLGLALHPDYPRNGRFFVNYTTKGSGLLGKLATRVSELASDPARALADSASEQVLLEFAQPYSNHNGGMVEFGLDGYLYIATGDGGSANDPHDNGQRLDTLLGKILRIDVDVTLDGRRYAIPPDNPFQSTAGARPEIFAFGLRNPWRISIDRATGLLYAGDVGQDEREEVDVVRAGGNYGWRIMEGSICTPHFGSACAKDGLEPPIVDYDHSQGYSITGGYVYRGAKWPQLCGVYLYGDYGSGRIWGLRYDGSVVRASRLVLESNLRISSFGQDDEGELYVVDYGGGILSLLAADD